MSILIGAGPTQLSRCQPGQCLGGLNIPPTQDCRHRREPLGLPDCVKSPQTPLLPIGSGTDYGIVVLDHVSDTDVALRSIEPKDATDATDAKARQPRL